MPKKIILAEDNKDLREIYISYISTKTEGVEVVAVEDGASLVDKVRGGGFSLILTDNDMPRMGGVNAIKEIREFDKETPIYMISASGAAKKAMEAGATGYIDKNFRTITKELTNVLNKYF